MRQRLCSLAVAASVLAACSNTVVPPTAQPSVAVAEVVVGPGVQTQDVAACLSGYIVRRGMRPRILRHSDPEHVHVVAYTMRRRGNITRALLVLDILHTELSTEKVVLSRSARPIDTAELSQNLRQFLTECGFTIVPISGFANPEAVIKPG